MNQLPPPTATLVLTRCTNRGSNPDLRILSPPLSPLKVLVRGWRHPITEACPAAVDFSGRSRLAE